MQMGTVTTSSISLSTTNCSTGMLSEHDEIRSQTFCTPPPNISEKTQNSKRKRDSTSPKKISPKKDNQNSIHEECTGPVGRNNLQENKSVATISTSSTGSHNSNEVDANNKNISPFYNAPSDINLQSSLGDSEFLFDKQG